MGGWVERAKPLFSFCIYTYFTFFGFWGIRGGIRQQLPLVKQKPATEVNSVKCCILITLLRAVIAIMPSVHREISSQFLNEARRWRFTKRNGRWLCGIFECIVNPQQVHITKTMRLQLLLFFICQSGDHPLLILFIISPSSSSSSLSIALVSTTNALSFCRQFVCGSLQQSYTGRASTWA